MKKQKLIDRNTYTPTGASQARSNCDLQLNKEETLSVASLKTSINNPEVNQSQHTSKRKVIVYVISVEGKPLMPCKPAKAKKVDGIMFTIKASELKKLKKINGSILV